MLATWDINTARAMGCTAPGRRVMRDGEGIRVTPDGGAIRVPMLLMDAAARRPATSDAETARAEMLRHLGDAWRGEAQPAPAAVADAETARAAWLADLAGAWRA